MITNKRQMYQHLNSGRWGNTFQSWNSWKEVLDSGYRGFMSVRSLKIGDPVRIYDVPFKEVEVFAPSHPNPLIFYESTPHETRVIQGEVYRGIWGTHFTYSFVKLPMRLAFAESQKYAQGTEALYLLRTYVDSFSWGHIQNLLGEYPDHVVEFTTFSVRVGKLERPTVIWEVRKY